MELSREGVEELAIWEGVLGECRMGVEAYGRVCPALVCCPNCTVQLTKGEDLAVGVKVLPACGEVFVVGDGK